MMMMILLIPVESHCCSSVLRQISSNGRDPLPLIDAMTAGISHMTY